MRLFILLFFVILQSCNSNTSKNNSNLSIGNDAKIDTNTAKKEADSNYSATKPKETEKKNWTYIDPDTLNIIREVFVIAKGGLTYREKPDITSRKISVFDYGKKLSIIEETGIPFKVKDGEEIIEGKWVKAAYIDYRYKQELLRSNWNIGYVFSGYTKDSSKIDFKNTPFPLFSFPKPIAKPKQEELKLAFSGIDSNQFKVYANSYKFEISRDTSKQHSELKSYDDKSIIELETSTHLFTITCTWSICNEYAGFINELNSYLLSGYGKETQAYYMLDKGNNSFLNLESHYDYGSGLPSLSPQSTKMITSENTDNRDEEYYDFKSEIVIYDISDIKYLDDIKTWKHFTTDDWRISSIAWIDENSFALEICDKIERDNKGKVKKLTNKRYLKATIE